VNRCSAPAGTVREPPLPFLFVARLASGAFYETIIPAIFSLSSKAIYSQSFGCLFSDKLSGFGHFEKSQKISSPYEIILPSSVCFHPFC